jgi:hypothetical protein
MTQRRSRAAATDKGDELVGTLRRVAFASEDTGWSVLELKTDQGQLVRAVGIAPHARPGERVRCTGLWVRDDSFARPTF